jgi:PHD/YefM family antitoxin component YafN of YafNO toxin-antitoxin module
MAIEFTPQQQKALDREKRIPRRVVDPRSQTAYVLVPEDEYEAMRELLEDEKREKAIHEVGLRNAAKRLHEAS